MHQPTLKLKIAFAICLVCWHGFALCLLALVSPSLCLSRRWPPSLSQSWFLSLYACGFASLFACVCLLRAWLLACLRACLRCFQQACLFVFCAAGVLQLTCPSQEQKRRHANNNSCHTPAPVQKLLFVKAQSTTYNRMHNYATFCTVFCMGSPKLLPNPRHSNIFNLLRMDPLRCHCFFLHCLNISKI